MRVTSLFLVLFAFAISHSEVYCQGNDPVAAALIEKTANYYKGLDSYRVIYQRELSNAKGKTQSTQKGELTIQGKQFRIISPDQEIFCNGTTIWNLDRNAQEVNVYEYEPEEDELNPTRIFSAYRKGYKYAFAGEVTDGKTVCQVINLEPEDPKKDISQIRVVINKADKTIRRWILTQRGANTRITFTVSKLIANPKGLNAESFSFDKKRFPKVKVIDLR